MNIYNYDKNTKEYLGVSTAQVNPKRKGEYLMPPNSTTIIPPDCLTYEIPVFNGDYWDIVPDYRKAEVINTQTHEITKINTIGKLEDNYMLYSDYVNTDEYAQYTAELEKQDAINEMLYQLRELDRKRVRAFCEPSIKNDETGESWLDYYNNQITELRTQLKEAGYGS